MTLSNLARGLIGLTLTSALAHCSKEPVRGGAPDPLTQREADAPITLAASATPKARAPEPSSKSEALPEITLGDRRVYDVVTSNEARVQDRILTQFSLTGKLTVTAIEVAPKRILMQAHVVGPKLETTQGVLRPRFVALERDLSQPFWFEFGPGGTVGAFYQTDSPSTLVLGIRRWLASALQAPQPTGGSLFTQHELDGTGRYLVEYKTAPGSRTFERRKLEYVTFDRATLGADTDGATLGADPQLATSPLVPRVLRSEGTVRLSERGVVEATQCIEEQSTGSEQMLPIESVLRIALSTVSADRLETGALPDLRQLLPRLRRVEGAGAGQASLESPEMDTARIGGRSLSDVLAGLRELRAEKPGAPRAEKDANSKRRNALYAALEALIRTRPPTVDALMKLIDRNDPIATTLVDALGSSGSIAAHRALVAMLKRGKQEPVLLKVAAIALSRTQRPSAASIEGLSALLDAPGLATQATYGLGTTIRRLREGHQEERAAPLVKLLVERLNTTTDPVQQVTLLRAIANSGHPAAFPSVAPLLSVSNPEIRAAALEALQLMAHPEVDAILARAATEDPAQNVRAAATRAARLRRPLPALREPITRTARSDANPHVRLSALHTLTTWLSIDPTLEPVIRDIATHEREQPIRVAATNALTRLTSQ